MNVKEGGDKIAKIVKSLHNDLTEKICNGIKGLNHYRFEE